MRTCCLGLSQGMDPCRALCRSPCRRVAACLLAGLLLCFTPGAAAYLSDWTLLGPGRPSQPTCVDIPRNMTLCNGIGYNKMRLPNLLDHDTMAEVSQQASSWVPLLNVRCHPDTQLFLCSLFSPVCLDRPIYPCRSLCDKVKQGCEGRMRIYGFPWPEMFRCDKFPVDNDMCITAQAGAHQAHDDGCQVCNQVETYENILDNFCRADFAVRAKCRRARKTKMACKKSKILKGNGDLVRILRRPVLNLQAPAPCCEEKMRNNRDAFLIMGNIRDSKFVPSFIMPWGKQSKPFKKAVRMFKKHPNCSDPKLVSHSMIGDVFGPTPATAGADISGSLDARMDRRKRGKAKGIKKMTWTFPINRVPSP